MRISCETFSIQTEMDSAAYKGGVVRVVRVAKLVISLWSRLNETKKGKFTMMRSVQSSLIERTREWSTTGDINSEVYRASIVARVVF